MSVDLPALGSRPGRRRRAASARGGDPFPRPVRLAAPCAARDWSTSRTARCRGRRGRRGDQHALALVGEVGEQLLGARLDRRSSRRRACRSARPARDPRRSGRCDSSPRRADRVRRELGMEAVVDEGVGVRAGDDEDRSAVSAVAAAGTAARNELLATKCQAAVPAVARRDVDVDFVNEHKECWPSRHGGLRIKSPIAIDQLRRLRGYSSGRMLMTRPRAPWSSNLHPARRPWRRSCRPCRGRR